MKSIFTLVVILSLGCSSSPKDPVQPPADPKPAVKQEPAPAPEKKPDGVTLERFAELYKQLTKDSKEDPPKDGVVPQIELEDLIANHRALRGKRVEITSWCNNWGGTRANLPDYKRREAYISLSDYEHGRWMKAIGEDYMKPNYVTFSGVVDIRDANGIIELRDGKFIRKAR